MKTLIQSILEFAKRASVLLVGAVSLIGGQSVLANNSSQLSQVINAGALSVDIVDGSGNAVVSPAVSFGALSFSFDNQDGSGTLGTASEKIRLYNRTSSSVWTVSIAATNPTDLWQNGGSAENYDFNDGSGYTDGADADTKGGQMTVNPASGTIAAVSSPGRTCTTANVSLGASDSFVQSSVDSIDLMSASAGANTFCRWDLTGVSLSQRIPGGQAADSYSMTMVLTAV